MIARKVSEKGIDAELIEAAAVYHDIGKMRIPKQILSKPGKLADEEYTVIKSHSSMGAGLIHDISGYENNSFLKTAYEISRWHHEKYDGHGYPDRLTGDEIPLSAQIASIADVYDALISKRSYKLSFTHEKAMNMILNGECGTFNQKLLQCFQECSAEDQSCIA